MTEKKKVLVISRSPAGQAYLTIILNRIGYPPLLAKTAGQGIHLAQEHSPSLIIFDSFLPKHEMHSVISAMRYEDSIKDLPLIVATMDDTAEERETLSSLGCSAVLSKPVDLAQAYEVFARLTEQPRKTFRIPVRLQVDIGEGMPEQTLTCSNLSEGGMYLHTHQPLPENTAMHLKFMLPLGNEEVSVTAEVVRTNQLGTMLNPEPGMGLRFVDIPHGALQQIRNYIQWKTMGDLEWGPDIADMLSAEGA